jgi:very-short-patch-repair endonuclease
VNKTEIFIIRASKVHQNKYVYSEVDYVNNQTKVKIICPLHGEFFQIPKNHLNNHGCPKCALEFKSKNSRFSLEKVVRKFKKIHGNLYGYSLVDYINNHTKVKIICKKHGMFEQQPKHHNSGSGCPKCSGNLKLTNSEFIKKSKKFHGDKYDYSEVKYTNSHVKVKIICRKHGIFEQQPTHHINGSGCPICRSSKSEQIIENLLKENKINYIRQYKFEGCKNKRELPFDFYLKDYNVCIEYDGVHHFKSVEIFGGEEGFKKTKNNDNIKTKFCLENNIELIRIKYNQKIKTIMKKFT